MTSPQPVRETKAEMKADPRGFPGPSGGEAPRIASPGRGRPTSDAAGVRKGRAYPSPRARILDRGTLEGKQRAAVILDVLAGRIPPSGAASAVGLSLSRYYLMEAVGIAGLVKACEPKPMGREGSVERRLEAALRENARLKNEGERLKALVRVAQRSIGLSIPESPPGRGPGGAKGDGKDGKGAKGRGKRRRPVVRALRAAADLRKEPRATEAGQGMAPPAIAPAAPAPPTVSRSSAPASGPEAG